MKLVEIEYDSGRKVWVNLDLVSCFNVANVKGEKKLVVSIAGRDQPLWLDKWTPEDFIKMMQNAKSVV